VPEVGHAVQGGGAGAGRLVAGASEPPVDGHNLSGSEAATFVASYLLSGDQPLSQLIQ
jgi:hypothetical protein